MPKPIFKIKKSKNGLGVFALKSFAPQKMLFRVKGKIVHWKKLLAIGNKTLDNAFRFGKETYLCPPADSLGALLNHSCDPNSGVRKIGNTIYVMAIKKIPRGEEITIDYSTLIGKDDSWQLTCNCGEKKCRKKVKSFDTLPLDTRNYYIKKKIVPSYIIASFEKASGHDTQEGRQ